MFLDYLSSLKGMTLNLLVAAKINQQDATTW